MQLSVPIERLQKEGLFVATPCYGGMCTGLFARSIADLSAVCTHHKIPLQIYFLFNESLITRARNYCCDTFLQATHTYKENDVEHTVPFEHMMFIDSDIGFNAQDILAMMAMQSKESEYDVLCGPYPKKCISWEKIKVAVDKGFADENPNDLEKFVGDFVFNPKANTREIALNEPAEVLEGGTGFMMIRRPTFNVIADKRPDLLYKPDHVRTEQFDGSREIMAYFDCIIDPESKRYLSEDYKFCYDVQKLGMKVWLCPWMQLSHVGTYIFGGSLSALAAVGLNATCDPEQIEKTKPRSKKIK